MDDNKNKSLPEDGEAELFTLTDEDGNELSFEVIAQQEIKGSMYYAMIPADAEPKQGEDSTEDIYEYVILKAAKDDEGADILVTVDDDDEFDEVADFFDDFLADEVDYDVESGESDKK